MNSVAVNVEKFAVQVGLRDLKRSFGSSITVGVDRRGNRECIDLERLSCSVGRGHFEFDGRICFRSVPTYKAETGLNHVKSAVAVPVLAFVEHSVSVGVFDRSDRDSSELEKTRADFFPRIDRRVKDGDESQEAQHRHDFERHDVLERVVDLPTENQGDHREHKNRDAEPL